MSVLFFNQYHKFLESCYHFGIPYCAQGSGGLSVYPVDIIHLCVIIYLLCLFVLFSIMKGRLLAISLQCLVHCCIKECLININSRWELQAILHRRFTVSLKIISRISYIPNIIFHRNFQFKLSVL